MLVHGKTNGVTTLLLCFYTSASKQNNRQLPYIASPCNSDAAMPQDLAERRSHGPPHDQQHITLHVRQHSHAPYFRLRMFSTADTCVGGSMTLTQVRL